MFTFQLNLTTPIKQVPSQLLQLIKDGRIEYKGLTVDVRSHNCGKRPLMFVKQMMFFANKAKPLTEKLMFYMQLNSSIFSKVYSDVNSTYMYSTEVNNTYSSEATEKSDA